MGGERDHRAYRVTGRVQGVGFRWWTSRTAEALGLTGSVRNRADGSVEVHAAGAPEALERFRRSLEEGPRGARVERVERVEPVQSDLPLPADAFRIVH